MKTLKKVIIYSTVLLMSVTAISCANNADEVSGNSSLHNSVVHFSSTSLSENSKTISSYESEATQSQAESKPVESKPSESKEESKYSESKADTNSSKPSESQTTSEEGKTVTKNPPKDFIMMYQTDPKYANHPYGKETVGGYACGPSVMAVIIKNLTGADVNPVTMSDWSYAKGYYVAGIGSAYGLMPAAANNWGLECKTFYTFDKEFLRKTLESGQMVLVVMGPGTFTYSGHFMILRGFDENGMLLIADTQSEKKTMRVWDFDSIYSELKKGSPIWTFK